MKLGSEYAQELFEFIQSLAPYVDKIKNYVPTADVREIRTFNDLIKLLTVKSGESANDIICNSSKEFKRAVYYVKAYNPSIDEEFLITLVKSFAEKAAAQQQMSAEDLLKEMRKYKKLIQLMYKHNRKKDEKIVGLMEEIKFILNEALTNYKGISGNRTRHHFKSALDVISDIICSIRAEAFPRINTGDLHKLITGELERDELSQLVAHRKMEHIAKRQEKYQLKNQ